MLKYIYQGVEEERLDRFLTSMTKLTRSSIKSAITQKRVLVDGQPARKAGQLLKSGVLVEIVPEEDLKLSAEPYPLDIVYEDQDIILVNKPAGMMVHPVQKDDRHTLVHALLAHTSLANGEDPLRPGIVHRLDKDTSGLILVAKTANAYQVLSNGFRKHLYERRYLAIVTGLMSGSFLTISAPISRSAKHPLKRQVMVNGREAQTYVDVLDCGLRETLISCRLEQGRTHQIRVHLSSIGHPLVGDWLYGRAKNRYGFKGQALHSWQIVFTHPISGVKMHFFVAPPILFQEAINQMDTEKIKSRRGGK